MIRVAWNLLWLRPGVVGGSEEYATRQLRALATLGAERVDVTAFVLEPFADAHPGLARDVRCVVAPIDGASKARRVACETSWLAARTRHGFDVVHHLGGRIPRLSHGPLVVTVHDLQPLEHPENFSLVKRSFLARSIPRSVRRAQVVLTPSEHVRRRVLVHFPLDPALVRACPAPLLAPTAASGPGGPPPITDPALAELAAEERPYAVYPAITYTHKNHAVLLDAFARVRSAVPEARLVLPGGSGGAEAAVAARCSAPDLAGAVLRPGRVPRDVLDRLLAGARVLAFPSRYEGSGLPVVEALAAGCPVVAADVDALREVLAGDGVLVGPDDVAGWAAALTAALQAPRDDTARSSVARRATERYAPGRTVDTLVAAYHDAAGW